MISQLNVLVSIAMVLVTVNDVPADFDETVRFPTLVVDEEVSVKKIREFAVTAVVLIVTVPPTNVPVPAEAFEPVVI